MIKKILKRSSQCSFILYTIFYFYSVQLCLFPSSFLWAAESPNPPIEMMIDSLGDPFHPYSAKLNLIREDFCLKSKDSIKPVVAVIPVTKGIVPIQPRKPSKKRAPASLPVLKVTGIFYKTKYPMVIINGNVLSLGDRSGGVRILAIRKDYIDIDFDGFLYKISLKD